MVLGTRQRKVVGVLLMHWEVPCEWTWISDLFDHASHLPKQTWGLGICLVLCQLSGVSQTSQWKGGVLTVWMLGRSCRKLLIDPELKEALLVFYGSWCYLFFNLYFWVPFTNRFTSLSWIYTFIIENGSKWKARFLRFPLVWISCVLIKSM